MKVQPTPFHRPSAARRAVLGLVAASGLTLLAYGAWNHAHAPIEAKHGNRPNPFRGLPGCLLFAGGGGEAQWRVVFGQSVACPHAKPVTAGFVGQSIELEQALTKLAQGPATSLPEREPQAEVVQLGSRRIAKTPNLRLSLDATRQQAAQQLANCMTGSADAAACTLLGVKPRADRHEGAAARVLALVDLDTSTGAVRTMASAHSPCYAAHWRAEQMPSDCPDMPRIDQAQAWRTQNHALFTEAMPGSIIKPWLALALALSDHFITTPKGQDWLRQTLKTSNSKALFDRVLCADQAATSARAASGPTNVLADCKRVDKLKEAAQQLGFEGAQGLSPLEGLQSPPARLFQAFDAQARNYNWLAPRLQSEALLRECRARGYEQCRGADVAELIGNFWGQASASVSVLGAAHMMARLSAAANGQPTSQPQLILANGTRAVVPTPVNGLPPRAAAQRVLAAMDAAHLPGGTAHAACVAVIGSAKCAGLRHIASKTGTPAFVHEAMTASQRAQHCDALAADPFVQAMSPAGRTRHHLLVQQCAMRPFKWFVVATRDPASGFYTRAIAVLAERNYATTGHIDSKGDAGVNVAAELAFRYLAATDVLVGTPPGPSHR
jgi:hypothetical protein